MTIPYAIIDSGSNISIITENLVNKLGLEVDKNNITEIAVIRNSAKTVGTSYNLPITLEQDDNRIEITDDFAVIEEDNNEPFVLLGTPWLYHAGWQPIVKGNSNGKNITIPLFVHKAQREVFTAESKLKKNA